MPTKPRTTKKPAAKPKRKITVGRNGIPKPATAEDIGRSVGDALGRRLEDLLAKPEPGAAMSGRACKDAVSAWTCEKLGEGVTGYLANYATDIGPSPIAVPTDAPPVSDAMDRIAYALNCADSITQIEHRKLEKYLLPAPANNSGCGASVATRGLSDFVRALNEIADRIYADNDARRNILDRLEL